MVNPKLPKYIQPISMADRAETLAGNLALSSFTRLSPLLMSNEGEVSIELKFGRDVERINYLQGTITTDLCLECQRCLRPMNYPLQLTTSLSPVFTEAAAKKLPPRYEPLMLDTDQIDLITIVEDEILLAMPLVPKHEDPNCAAAANLL